jgi:hypothetical protein
MKTFLLLVEKKQGGYHAPLNNLNQPKNSLIRPDVLRWNDFFLNGGTNV